MVRLSDARMSGTATRCILHVSPILHRRALALGAQADRSRLDVNARTINLECRKRN